jgi:hypothetical protein
MIAVVTAAIPVAVDRAASARDLSGKAGLAFLGRRIDIALGEKQRFRRLAELRAQRAGMNQAGFGAVGLGRRGHYGLLQALRTVVPKPLSGAMRTANKKPAGEMSRPGSRVPGLLAICLTWLQAGRLK